jgi:acyl carrier protein
VIVATDYFDSIRSLVVEICAVDKAVVTPQSKLVGFGLDSVRLLDLILAIEDRFGISINESDPELVAVQTVADLVSLVQRRASAR